MNKMKWSVLIIAIIQLVILSGGYFFPEEKGYAQEKVTMTTLDGLDLNMVRLSIHAPRKYEDRLFNRALHHFSEAGLSLRDSGPLGRFDPVLVLTLDFEPLTGASSKDFLYYRKLELKENVLLERDPEIKRWGVTYFYGIPGPFVTDDVTIERLETDLDGLLEHFIMTYKISNPG